MMAAVAFTGCVDDINIEDQFGETRKLVLYCRLCPQMDSTYILLSNSQLIFGQDTGCAHHQRRHGGALR